MTKNDLNKTGDKVNFKSGFVALAGKPNVGKSTLLNRLAGMKLAIVTEKPQTTRENVNYIHDDEKSQIVFTDTPGLYSPKNYLDKKMMEVAKGAAMDSDIVLLITETGEYHMSKHERVIYRHAKSSDKPVFLLINKVDKVKKESILPLIAGASQEYDFDEYLPVSAKTGDGIDLLMELLYQYLHEGERFYPKDSLTDRTERDIAADFIRESIFSLTNQEIPYGTGVEIESFEEDYETFESSEGKIVRRDFVSIHAAIYCEKPTHKKIIIGKNGAMIKRIGSSARIRIEELLGTRVNLQLFVKVRRDWRNNPRHAGGEVK